MPAAAAASSAGAPTLARAEAWVSPEVGPDDCDWSVVMSPPPDKAVAVVVPLARRRFDAEDLRVLSQRLIARRRRVTAPDK